MLADYAKAEQSKALVEGLRKRVRSILGVCEQLKTIQAPQYTYNFLSEVVRCGASQKKEGCKTQPSIQTI